MFLYLRDVLVDSFQIYCKVQLYSEIKQLELTDQSLMGLYKSKSFQPIIHTLFKISHKCEIKSLDVPTLKPHSLFCASWLKQCVKHQHFRFCGFFSATLIFVAHRKLVCFVGIELGVIVVTPHDKAHHESFVLNGKISLDIRYNGIHFATKIKKIVYSVPSRS